MQQFYAMKHSAHLTNISIDKNKILQLLMAINHQNSLRFLYLFDTNCIYISHWWKIEENFTYPVQDIHFPDPFKKGNTGMG